MQQPITCQCLLTVGQHRVTVPPDPHKKRLRRAPEALVVGVRGGSTPHGEDEQESVRNRWNRPETAAN
eukprot:661662-Alexandrium_andersonii.AAC.1